MCTPAECSALARDIVRYWDDALEPHLAVEERFLLPAIAAVEDGGLVLAGRAQREHRELSALVTSLRTAEVVTRAGLVARFGAALAAHIRWEERDLLEWVMQRLDVSEANRIAAGIAATLPRDAVPCPVPHLTQ